MSDLETLDSYLSSDESPEECMMLSDLDGFLHGIVCSPSEVPVDEWMTVALGAPPEEMPRWVLESVSVIYASILQGLSSDPSEAEPIFWQAAEGHVIAMDWCEGFMQAVSLRPQEWLKLTESDAGGKLITPIMVHLLDDNGNSVLGIPQEELDETLAQAADAIPDSVIGIYHFWVSMGQN